MSAQSRVKKTVLNARINLIFYLLSLLITFFTRNIFLMKLGDDFVGLTTTLKNILGFLNLAELGVSGAIGYVLYRPLFDKDQGKLNEIISVFGYIYQRIGTLITVLGILLSLFLPLIFKETSIDISVIYYLYYSLLISSLLGYFINYKQTLLAADQKSYVVTAAWQGTIIAKTIIQALIAYYTQNYYIWITIEILFGILYSFILNWRIASIYPWLKGDIKLGKGLLKKYPDISKYTKQLFVHKIAGFAQTQLTPLLLYAFVSLQMVAIYGNYTLIIAGLAAFIYQLLGSTEASVGNLIAEGNSSKIIRIYWELFAIRFFIAGVVVFGLYHLIDPFITLWLGREYLLENSTLILILISLFFNLSRGATDVFKYGYALFSDVWAPIAEAAIFITTALIGGSIWGVDGVLMGSATSLLLIIQIWHPLFLFRAGFKISIRSYFIPFIKYMAVYAICFVGTNILIDSFISTTEASSSYFSWLKHSATVIMIFSPIYLTAIYITSKGMRDSFARLTKLK